MRAWILPLLVLSAVPAETGEHGNATIGRFEARANCSLCHDVEPKPMRFSGTAPHFTEIAKTATLGSLQRYVVIEKHGRIRAPTLTPRQFEDIAAYILSLKGQGREQGGRQAD